MSASIASSNVSGASDMGFSRSRSSFLGSFVAGTRELLGLDFFFATAAFSAYSDDRRAPHDLTATRIGFA
jgi:hypothetical protein